MGKVKLLLWDPCWLLLPIIAFPATTELIREPLGLVYIISSSNYPIVGLSLEPIIGAIAAGNVVVLKPSELAPTCSAVVASVINKYLASKAIKVFQGGVSVSQQLFQQKWDKIFFTGSDGAEIGGHHKHASAVNEFEGNVEIGGHDKPVSEDVEA
ncbi:Aldedh domain-containing protein [Heracleum sosnowskyi]|uniref:Aldedh domain-containing protein n=1 Tax=Heracleum sosnowskyi TaxID=360622 RepID=A0AAD8JC08_9APIA|nr:Aldedh domain-containing protein [Heracleum sosnowskyi]